MVHQSIYLYDLKVNFIQFCVNISNNKYVPSKFNYSYLFVQKFSNIFIYRSDLLWLKYSLFLTEDK